MSATTDATEQKKERQQLINQNRQHQKANVTATKPIDRRKTAIWQNTQRINSLIVEISNIENRRDTGSA